MVDLLDKLLAVTAMLVSIGPLLRGASGSARRLSWRRGLVLGLGGLAAVLAAVGLLALESQILERPFFLPSLLGATLALFGGMLGTSTLLAARASEQQSRGLTEDTAIRTATQALAMTLYVAAPRLTLAGLGLTRLLRATLPFTVARTRWAGAVEGLVLLGLCALPRSPDLGGLRVLARDLLGT